MKWYPIPKWIPFKRGITLWWPWRREPRIYLPKSRTSDPGRLERTLDHEAVHCIQWRLLGRVRFAWRYLTSQKHRLELEAEAFAASVRWWPIGTLLKLGPGLLGRVPPIHYYAHALSKGYRLKYGVSECREAIQRYL